MRNPERIDLVLKVIESIWKSNPDFRLAQLLLNADPKLSYGTEDDELFVQLQKRYPFCQAFNEPDENWAPSGMKSLKERLESINEY